MDSKNYKTSDKSVPGVRFFNDFKNIENSDYVQSALKILVKSDQ